MTPTEILTEIQKLPLGEIQKVSQGVNQLLDKDDLEQREKEFAEYLLQKGAIEKIPPCDETDEEFAEIEPIEFEGEPLSEQIIRERI
ncbi:MAG: hypothetical protein H0X15_04095 [Acidobacteria bacterium]|jgi:hypothetical protein|nr:hypothetical protein [Acidobacteriota bacterium]MBA3784708.1 hypothetical protein [Acidobacteriota bacterium]MBA4122945.1 hypothetical protein [Acidobacteriota bacterium]MBA4182831.1 hypothetical protein [Acidobacteriota bacterium]